MANDCPFCKKGRIFFEVEHHGMVYDRFLACECPDGDRAAIHIAQIRRLNGSPISHPNSVRYNYIFSRQGGLGSATDGIGKRLADTKKKDTLF